MTDKNTEGESSVITSGHSNNMHRRAVGLKHCRFDNSALVECSDDGGEMVWECRV